MKRLRLLFIGMLFVSGCGPRAELVEDLAPQPTPPNAEAPLVERGPCQSQELLDSWPQGASNSPPINSSLLNLTGVDRDLQVLDEVGQGHSGSLVDQVTPVIVSRGNNEILLCVMNDYLTLLDQGEKIRFPLGMTAVAELVAASDWRLPTRKMVDLIYNNGEHVLAPRPIPPSPAMTTTPVIIDHSEIINQQLEAKTGLVVGHKKDVVISARLITKPQRIAIYGWHRTNGSPIQPLSTVHHKDYADYSHGVRLIYKTVWLNGVATPLAEILKDRQLSDLLSDEDPLPQRLIDLYYP